MLAKHILPHCLTPDLHLSGWLTLLRSFRPREVVREKCIMLQWLCYVKVDPSRSK